MRRPFPLCLLVLVLSTPAHAVPITTYAIGQVTMNETTPRMGIPSPSLYTFTPGELVFVTTTIFDEFIPLGYDRLTVRLMTAGGFDFSFPAVLTSTVQDLGDRQVIDTSTPGVVTANLRLVLPKAVAAGGARSNISARPRPGTRGSGGRWCACPTRGTSRGPCPSRPRSPSAWSGRRWRAWGGGGGDRCPKYANTPGVGRGLAGEGWGRACSALVEVVDRRVVGVIRHGGPHGGTTRGTRRGRGRNTVHSLYPMREAIAATRTITPTITIKTKLVDPLK